MKKLKLNKESISKLNTESINQINGGKIAGDPTDKASVDRACSVIETCVCRTSYNIAC